MDLKKFEAELEQGGTTIHKEKTNVNNITPIALEKKPVEGKAQRKRFIFSFCLFLMLLEQLQLLVMELLLLFLMLEYIV